MTAEDLQHVCLQLVRWVTELFPLLQLQLNWQFQGENQVKLMQLL